MDSQYRNDPSSAQRVLERKSVKAAKKRNWGTLVAKLLVTIIFTFLILFLVAGATRVSGRSMEPTLRNGDVVLFHRLGGYQKGDVVVLRTEEKTHLIKRIVAVEGDVVDIDDKRGILLVNGVSCEESYIYTQTYRMGTKVEYPLKLEEGQVFVLGDNRTVSKDSRELGPIEKKQIDGRAVASFHLFSDHKENENKEKEG